MRGSATSIVALRNKWADREGAFDVSAMTRLV